jgi:hypothetical protein
MLLAAVWLRATCILAHPSVTHFNTAHVYRSEPNKYTLLKILDVHKLPKNRNDFSNGNGPISDRRPLSRRGWNGKWNCAVISNPSVQYCIVCCVYDRVWLVVV